MSKIRHRRKKSEMPFADALAAATKRLARATREREQAQASLAALNAEIPNLQRTIAALRAQLEGLPLGSAPRVEDAVYQPRAAIPEGVTLPPDDLTGIGSTRISVDEDVLPDAEGTPLIEE